MTTQQYGLRPGRLSDIAPMVTLWEAAFGHDMLLDILFPNRHTNTRAFLVNVERLFSSRWWDPHYDMTVLYNTETGERLGFTWWKRPTSELSFYERWISPYAWFCPIVQAYYSVRDWLFPVPDLDKHAAGTFTRAFSAVEPQVLNTPRRKSAHYLSTLAVWPKYQGQGLGTILLRDGLKKVDERGRAAWLVGIRGVEPFYARHGFTEVARANVGELEHWEGGAVMVRNG